MSGRTALMVSISREEREDASLPYDSSRRAGWILRPPVVEHGELASPR